MNFAIIIQKLNVRGCNVESFMNHALAQVTLVIIASFERHLQLASFQGHLQLHFFDHIYDLWTALRSRKAWYNSCVIKPQGAWTRSWHMWTQVLVILAICQHIIASSCEYCSWSFSCNKDDYVAFSLLLLMMEGYVPVRWSPVLVSVWWPNQWSKVSWKWL